MTACTNKARGAVVAALAGVLALGAVPAVALATGTADAGDVQLMASDAANAFSNGAVVVTNVGGATSGQDGYTISYDGTAIKPTVDKVTPRGESDAVSISDSNDYRVYYVKANEKGEPGDEKVSAIVDAGTYYVVVEAVSGDYAGGKATVKFTVTGLTLGTVSYEDENGSTSLTYDAEPVDLTFKSGSTELRKGIDYTVKYFKAGEDINNSSLGSETAPTDAGNYSAVLTGAGAYAGSKTAKVDFTIGKLNLGTLTEDKVYVPTVVGETAALPTTPTTVNGSEALASKLKYQYSSTTAVGECRKYSPNVVPATENDPNFVEDTKGKDIFFKVMTGVSFTYDGKELPSEILVNKGEKEGFNAWGDVTAEWVDKDGKKQTKVMGQTDCTITDEDGVDATADLVAGNAGTYVITYNLVDETGFQYGGSAQVKLVVIDAAIDCADNLYVSYKGNVVSSIEKVYNGNGVQNEIDEVSLYSGDTKITSGWAYHFENSEGDVVTDVRTPGDYKLVVTSDVYQLSNATVDITITKAEIQALRIPTVKDSSTTSGDRLTGIDGQYAIAFDGDVLSPAFEYTTGERNVDGDLVWHMLTGSDVAAVTKLSLTLDGKDANVVKEAGAYVATLTLLDTDASKNYELSAEPYEFTVAKSDTFVDVNEGDWYYDSVNKAHDNEYIFGYGNGKFFGPNDFMTRADVAVVLYRMSGGIISPVDEDAYSENKGWDTGFADVDGNAYYAKAIAWAAKAGVVHGYDNGDFGPTDTVTREQFATMLANYAKLFGEDVVSATADLSAYPDGGTVSAYAKEAVEWTVAEKIMGKDTTLRPGSEVSRAEVAAMAVKYQPAPIA